MDLIIVVWALFPPSFQACSTVVCVVSLVSKGSKKCLDWSPNFACTPCDRQRLNSELYTLHDISNIHDQMFSWALLFQSDRNHVAINPFYSNIKSGVNEARSVLKILLLFCVLFSKVHAVQTSIPRRLNQCCTNEKPQQVVAQRKCDFNWLSLIKPSPFLHWYILHLLKLCKKEKKNVFLMCKFLCFFESLGHPRTEQFCYKKCYICSNGEPTASSCFWAEECLGTLVVQLSTV